MISAEDRASAILKQGVRAEQRMELVSKGCLVFKEVMDLFRTIFPMLMEEVISRRAMAMEVLGFRMEGVFRAMAMAPESRAAVTFRNPRCIRETTGSRCRVSKEGLMPDRVFPIMGTKGISVVGDIDISERILTDQEAGAISTKAVGLKNWIRSRGVGSRRESRLSCRWLVGSKQVCISCSRYRHCC
jgi:hypothetical protein